MSDEKVAFEEKQIDKRKKEARKRNEAERAYFESLRNSDEQKTYTLDEARRIAWANLNELSLKQNGVKFEITDFNTPLLSELARYVSKDEDFGKDEGWRNKPHLRKGIMIFGSFGAGKSLIMRSFLPMLDCGQRIAEHVVSEYERTDNYSRFTKGDWYFDDLGNEPQPKFAKADALPIFSEILERRYYFNSYGHSPNKTYITTNHKPSKLGEVYGPRIESRLTEMFNIWFLDGQDYRKKFNEK